MKFNIDWSKQHCGVLSGSYHRTLELMPDLKPILDTFPDNPYNFSWDVKVHMLFPMQYPCIPNWHTDNVPRVNGIQRFDLCKPELPMYLWVSGAPLSQFRHGFLEAEHWHRFNQMDEHRGIPASDNCWRGFIRASHVELKKISETNNLRRHCQVYLDANSYQW